MYELGIEQYTSSAYIQSPKELREIPSNSKEYDQDLLFGF